MCTKKNFSILMVFCVDTYQTPFSNSFLVKHSRHGLYGPLNFHLHVKVPRLCECGEQIFIKLSPPKSHVYILKKSSRKSAVIFISNNILHSTYSNNPLRYFHFTEKIQLSFTLLSLHDTME